MVEVIVGPWGQKQEEAPRPPVAPLTLSATIQDKRGLLEIDIVRQPNTLYEVIVRLDSDLMLWQTNVALLVNGEEVDRG